MYSVKALLGHRCKPTVERFGMWLIKANLDDNNLLTDIGDINFTENAHKVERFCPITDIFFDNIMLVKIANTTD